MMDEFCDPTGAGWIISPEFHQTNDERTGNMTTLRKGDADERD